MVMITLTTIEVTMGKWKEKFSLRMLISPGSLPRFIPPNFDSRSTTAPAAAITIPVIIRNLAISFVCKVLYAYLVILKPILRQFLFFVLVASVEDNGVYE